MNPVCYYQGKTTENPKGTDCMAHLAEARVFKCPYTSRLDAAKRGCAGAEEVHDSQGRNQEHSRLYAEANLCQ